MAWLRRGAAAGLSAWTEAKPTPGLTVDAPPNSNDWNDFWEPTGGIQHATQGLPRCPRLQNLVRRGVPPDQRAALWRLCAAPGRPGHYDALLEQQQVRSGPALARPRTRPPGSRPPSHSPRSLQTTRLALLSGGGCLDSFPPDRQGSAPHVWRRARGPGASAGGAGFSAQCAHRMCVACPPRPAPPRPAPPRPAPPRPAPPHPPAPPAHLEATASSSRVAPRVQTRATTPRSATVSR
jgi:hypothetical protein